MKPPFTLLLYSLLLLSILRWALVVVDAEGAAAKNGDDAVWVTFTSPKPGEEIFSDEEVTLSYSVSSLGHNATASIVARVVGRTPEEDVYYPLDHHEGLGSFFLRELKVGSLHVEILDELGSDGKIMAATWMEVFPKQLKTTTFQGGHGHAASLPQGPSSGPSPSKAFKEVKKSQKSQNQCEVSTDARMKGKRNIVMVGQNALDGQAVRYLNIAASAASCDEWSFHYLSMSGTQGDQLHHLRSEFTKRNVSFTQVTLPSLPSRELPPAYSWGCPLHNPLSSHCPIDGLVEFMLQRLRVSREASTTITPAWANEGKPQYFLCWWWFLLTNFKAMLLLITTANAFESSDDSEMQLKERAKLLNDSDSPPHSLQSLCNCDTILHQCGPR